MSSPTSTTNPVPNQCQIWVILCLGDRVNSAHTHISIICDQERVNEPSSDKSLSLLSSDDKKDDMEDEIQMDDTQEETAEDLSDQQLQNDLIHLGDDEVMSNLSEESQRSFNIDMKSDSEISRLDKGAIDDYLNRSNEHLKTAVAGNNSDSDLKARCLTMHLQNMEIKMAVEAAPECERLIAGLEGIEFPLGTPVINWAAHNIKTFLPFTGDLGLSDRDSQWVFIMANAYDAGAVRDAPQFAVILEVPEELCRNSIHSNPLKHPATIRDVFVQDIRHHLANNRAVVIKKCSLEQGYGFSVEDIGMIHPSINHGVYWQDLMECALNFSRSDDEQKEVVKVTDLTEFILNVHDTSVCGNVLDLLNLRPDAPQWIHVLADDLNSLYITRRDHYGNPKCSKIVDTLDRTFQGPQVILYDMWRAQGWDIITHGSAVTYVHHDVSGFVTYVYLQLGSKLWGIICVKKDIKLTTHDDLFKAYDMILDESWTGIQAIAEIGMILLEEGDLLLQPPGAWHTVYTPLKGMTSGGHLVSYNSLHLTENICAYDHSMDEENVKRGSYATNESTVNSFI
ncbi:hypothetical protein PILCRDRAFT_1764 [Piloderma croceum F 1598]|uniref:JmjC domain-containing protein n=1 Tax=Piloderma croceum (strain F 1598) TaxID=765440 RepID=A0A0C3BV99_PILCF|nr:hypothetical protein PILCRDRAFT_1764 [Piloderma croceum F 1598]